MSTDLLPNSALVTVCAECLQASCWLGEFMCQRSKNANIVALPVRALRIMDLENEEWWSKALAPATPAPESPAPAPDCKRCGDTGSIGHSRGYDGEAYEIDCPECHPDAPEVGTGSETSPDAGASREAERMSETLYRAMSEREALRKALAEIHTLSGRRFASMEDVNHIAYAAITAPTTPKAEQSPSFLDVEPARKHHRDCVSLRGAPNCNCDRQDWYEILKAAATKEKFINRMSILYLDTFAKAIRAVLSEAKPAEASDAEQIPHPVAEAEQSPQPAGLVWTREHPPEADRWYWLLVPNGRPECVWVHEESDGWYIDDTEYGEQNPIPLSDIIQFAQWAGPIPEPLAQAPTRTARKGE